MFGYVKVNSSELRVKEHELYRGTYCGLCRAMGKCTGQCSRMTLSYDFVFLALVRIVLEGREREVSFEQRRCLVHPLTKRNVMKRNASLDYAAFAAAILNYHKIADDISDEKGAKKLMARAIKPFVKHSAKKATRSGYAELDRRVAEGLERLSRFEAEASPSVDEPAELFGEILGEIMSHGLDGSRARIAYSLGKAVGAWIYIADALDDMRDDCEKGRYNPILLLYGGRVPSAEELEGISIALKNRLFEATDALDLMDFESEELKNILTNLLCLGMPERIEKIISGGGKCEKCAKKEKREERERTRKDR